MSDEGGAVQNAEQELRLAQLTEEYQGVLGQAHEAPDDNDLKGRKDDLAQQIVELRQDMRQRREAQTAALSDGEGVAQPQPVEGGSEVSG